MPDPFEALRAPITPVDPDPGFAARLRARMVRALTIPGGVDMSRIDVDRVDVDRVDEPRPPAGPRWSGGTRHGDLGYISYQLPDVERGVAFYSAVLGWRFDPPEGPGHPGRLVGDSLPMTNLWPADARPGLLLCWRIDDMAEAVERVRAAGGTAEPVQEEPFGLLVMCVDDQGMPFGMWEPTAASKAEVADVDPATRPLNGTQAGDVSYMTIEVVDSARTRAFYGAVLGWSFHPGRVGDGWGVDGPMPMHGLSGGHAEATAVPQFRVDDIRAAVDRVRAAGGTATDPQQFDYGWSAECADDQGVRFYLGQM